MYDLFLTLRNMARAIAAWRERQRVIDELHGLDDRSLADIGLSRGQIPYVFDEAPASFGAPVAANQSKPGLRHAA